MLDLELDHKCDRKSQLQVRFLSPTLYFLSCSKQSLLNIEKYENQEREVGDCRCRPPRVQK